MIIRLLINSDTYVTNLSTDNTEGVYANVGSAATLDLLKLYNENKNSKSRAFLNFDNTTIIPGDSEINFTDAVGNTLNIAFKDNITFAQSGWNGDETVYNIGISGENVTDYAKILSDSINILNDNSKIKITSEYHENIILLTQSEKGEIGDTLFDISSLENNDPAILTSLAQKTNNENYFARIDYSYILVNFSKEELTKWIPAQQQGAFTSGNFKAILKLKDVSTGLSKPSNYKLKFYELNNSFVEGNGKDTVNFSDSGIVNFENINKDDKWKIKSFISANDTLVDSDVVFNTTGNSNNNRNISGSEDIEFDITDYILKFINDNSYVNNGLLIGFDEEYLFDNKSYFVKRLGSRHLLNKSLVPYIDLIFDETKYEYSDYDIKKREFKIDEEEFNIFYLDYSDANISFKIIDEKEDPDDNVDIVGLTQLQSATNFKGENIKGLLKYNIILQPGENGELFLNQEHSQYAINNKGKKTFKLKWYDNLNNELGSESIDIVYYDYDSKTNKEDLYVTIKFDKDLTANNLGYLMSVYFIDRKEKVSANRKPYSLISKQLDNLYYEIINKNNEKVLVEKNTTGTNLKFNGECYQARVFISEAFRKNVLHIKFYYVDSFGNEGILENKNFSFKVD
jgi:hypothetical protein